MTGLYWDEDDYQEGLLTRRSPENCLSEKEIEDFLFQRLSGVSREAVEEHLLFCEDCRRKVEGEQEFAGAVRGAAQQLELEAIQRPLQTEVSRNEPGYRPERSKWAMAAAAVVVLLAASVSLRIFSPSGVAEVTLRAERSAEASMQDAAPERQSLLLRADLRGLPPLPSFRWLIVDRTGAPVTEGTVPPQPEMAGIRLPRGLPAGLYWVRIQDPETGMLLREFGLQVRPRGQAPGHQP